MLAMPIAAQASPVDDIVINEIESDDDTGGPDWIELINMTVHDVDASRLILSDSDPSHVLTHVIRTTYGRCPDPSGAFETTAVSTKGAAND